MEVLSPSRRKTASSAGTRIRSISYPVINKPPRHMSWRHLPCTTFADVRRGLEADTLAAYTLSSFLPLVGQPILDRVLPASPEPVPIHLTPESLPSFRSGRRQSSEFRLAERPMAEVTELFSEAVAYVILGSLQQLSHLSTRRHCFQRGGLVLRKFLTGVNYEPHGYRGH